MSWKCAVVWSNVSPSDGECLSGWYTSDNFLNCVLISLPVAWRVRLIAQRESMSVLPTLLWS